MNWDYCTHVPMLYEATRMTNGLVVELGVGLCSTPLLNALVTYGAEPRDLLSFDDNANWLNRARTLCSSEKHDFIHVIDWEKDLKQIADLKPSLVFIDNGSPDDIIGATALRIKMVDLFKDAGVLVIHDASNMVNAAPGFDKLIKQFTYVVEDNHSKPTTLWMSNTLKPQYLMR